MKNEEKLRAWEMTYDVERDALVMHYLDVEWMRDGYAKVAGEIVAANKLKLTPKEAKAACIERIENGTRELEAVRDRAIAGIKANRELLETAKKFPALEAANAAVQANAEPETPAIYLPGKGNTH